MFSKIKKTVNFFLIGVLIVSNFFLSPFHSEDNQDISNEVIPIDWGVMDKIENPDNEFKLIKEIMDNSTNYIMNTWYEENGYINLDTYIDFNGTEEFEIRGPAMAALGLAIPIATNTLNTDKLNITYDEALKRNLHLITSLAKNHSSNTEGGWGLHQTNDTNGWQTPLWSYYVGFSGWLLWDKLEESEKITVYNMVVSEANNIPEARYYKDKNGNELYEGNTQAEENSAWVSLLGLAVAMMPKHENAQIWLDQLIDLSVIAFSKPTDLTSDKQYNNRKISDILEGYNIEDNGTLINHGFMHPIYMLAIEQNMNVALMFSLAKIDIPEALFHNSDTIYYALTDLEFDVTQYLEPGGTIYQTNMDEIYFPEGNDWGEYFPMYFGQVDVLANVFGFDHLSSSDASYWSKKHNQQQLYLQKRSIDGRTYKNNIENNYKLKEERIAQISSSTYLAKWVEHQKLYGFTNNGVKSVRDIYKPFNFKRKIGKSILLGSAILIFIINVPTKLIK